MANPAHHVHTFPAAIGGHHISQLAHLKAHRAFQRQSKSDTARLYWNTTITRQQSYRHIGRHLNAKINKKDPSFFPPGHLNTDEGQEDLIYFTQEVRRGDAVGPGPSAAGPAVPVVVLQGQGVHVRARVGCCRWLGYGCRVRRCGWGWL